MTSHALCKVTLLEEVCNQSLCTYLAEKLSPLLLQSPFPLRLLEVGCGSGALAAILKNQYKDKIKYKAIDPSPENISKAHARGVSEAEVTTFEEHLPTSDTHYDVLLFTKSFHHLPSLPVAVQKAYDILKPGGLFIADEFGRELMDDATAKFVYEYHDVLECAGKFPNPPRHVVSDDKKLDYLYRWNSRYMPRSQHNKHEHEGDHHHEGNHHHESEHHHHASGHHHEGSQKHHRHPDVLPTSIEMLEALKKIFPTVETTPTSFFYHLISQRFDGTNATDEYSEIVKKFRKEEDTNIAEGKIVPLGLRIFATKN